MQRTWEPWTAFLLSATVLLSLPASSGFVPVVVHHSLVAMAFAALTHWFDPGTARTSLRAGSALTATYAGVVFVATHLGVPLPAVSGWAGALAVGLAVVMLGAFLARSRVSRTRLLAIGAACLVGATVLAMREELEPPIDLTVDAHVSGTRGRRVENWLFRMGGAHGGTLQTSFVSSPHDPVVLDLCLPFVTPEAEVRAIDAGLLVVPAGAPAGARSEACLLDRSAPRRIRGWVGHFPHTPSCSDSWAGALMACALLLVVQAVEAFARKDETSAREAAFGAALSGLGALALVVAYVVVAHRVIAE